MKREIAVCDICKREIDKVDTHAFCGHGSLKFKWSLGGYGGGAGDTISKDDLCCECTQKIRAAIESAISRIKSEVEHDV